MKLHIILGSTRPGRVGESVAQWAYEVARERTGTKVELVDVGSFDLPLLDEPASAFMSGPNYAKPYTKKWSQKIAEADGYLFVTPEYNHGVPGALKNAIDYLYNEWNDKAVGFVSYGMAGGVRSVEHLRTIAGELRMADVREQLPLFLASDFENFHDFKPTERHAAQLNKVIDQVVGWSNALRPLRTN